MSLSVMLVIGGGALLALLSYILVQVLVQNKFPRSRVEEFLARASSGPVAHRGGQPENTLAAFRLCKDLGASGIEVDLMFTKDDHPVLFHDDTVDRTSNGHGRVKDFTLEEIKSLDVGSKAGSEFAGEKVPTLYEALDICKKLDLLMFLELKEDAEKSAALIKKLFSEDPSLYDRVAVISFYPNIIYKLRKSDPNLLLGLVYRSGYQAYRVSGERRSSELWKHLTYVLLDALFEWSVKTWLWRVLGVSLLVVHKDDILASIFSDGLWEGRNVCVVAWTVNEVEEKQHFDSVLKMPYFTDCVTHPATSSS